MKFSKKNNILLITIITFLLVTSCHTSEKNKVSDTLKIDNEITIDAIQKALKNNEYTIEALTQFYLNRIDALSFNGPKLNAVITVNPDALTIAKQLDEELKNGKSRGALHGIPVLLKDNIDTHDKMPCTAGARAMENSFPLQDSPLVTQLREAGAVIIGKANLSEWANFHSYSSSSGWSGLGGQTKNPYNLTCNPCGSSSGSGVGVAANLCVLAIGTETNGSIICPSNNNGIVGIKPTVGLISRTGIIPISSTQDTAGPMARTVRDAAISLGAMTKTDPNDKKTMVKNRVAYTDYTPFLKNNGLKGKRIGYYKKPLGSNKRMTKVTEKAVTYFKKQGATIIEIDQIISGDVEEASFEMMLYEFKNGINNYFKSLGAKRSINNLEDLITKTFNDSIEMKYHDHQLLKLAQSKGDLNSEEYITAQKKVIEKSRKEGIDKLMNQHQLDAIIAPSGGPAWKTDLTNGDHFGIYGYSSPAIAGYPNITVPMGHIDGLPVGLSIFGKPWSEPILLEIAYSYEQGTQHRTTPKFLTESNY